MTFRWYGAMPCHYLKLCNHIVHRNSCSNFQWNSKQNANFPIRKIHLKMSSSKVSASMWWIQMKTRKCFCIYIYVKRDAPCWMANTLATALGSEMCLWDSRITYLKPRSTSRSKSLKIGIYLSAIVWRLVLKSSTNKMVCKHQFHMLTA